MRVIYGSLKATPLPWPSVLANIIRSEVRKNEALVNIVSKHDGIDKSMLPLMMKTPSKV